MKSPCYTARPILSPPPPRSYMAALDGLPAVSLFLGGGGGFAADCHVLYAQHLLWLVLMGRTRVLTQTSSLRVLNPVSNNPSFLQVSKTVSGAAGPSSEPQ